MSAIYRVFLNTSGMAHEQIAPRFTGLYVAAVHLHEAYREDFTERTVRVLQIEPAGVARDVQLQGLDKVVHLDYWLDSIDVAHEPTYRDILQGLGADKYQPFVLPHRVRAIPSPRSTLQCPQPVLYPGWNMPCTIYPIGSTGRPTLASPKDFSLVVGPGDWSQYPMRGQHYGPQEQLPQLPEPRNIQSTGDGSAVTFHLFAGDRLGTTVLNVSVSYSYEDFDPLTGATQTSRPSLVNVPARDVAIVSTPYTVTVLPAAPPETVYKPSIGFHSGQTVTVAHVVQCREAGTDAGHIFCPERQLDGTPLFEWVTQGSVWVTRGESCTEAVRWRPSTSWQYEYSPFRTLTQCQQVWYMMQNGRFRVAATFTVPMWADHSHLELCYATSGKADAHLLATYQINRFHGHSNVFLSNLICASVVMLAFIPFLLNLTWFGSCCSICALLNSCRAPLQSRSTSWHFGSCISPTRENRATCSLPGHKYCAIRHLVFSGQLWFPVKWSK